MIAKVKELRKELHQYPELSGEEIGTAKRIKSFISKYHPTKILDNLGGNGLAAIYEYSNQGATIAIRCELDALPIVEKNRFDYRSKNNGVSHKCGHDGHMAIVAGLMFWIKEQSFAAGKIVLLFQPAEETGKGAARILADRRFNELNIDYIFALHNIPGVPLHTVILPRQGFSAEVQSLAIYFKGKESHASEPENGINPAQAIAEITSKLYALNLNNPKDDGFSILTPIHIHMGQKSYGISPANGELHYTIRTWSSKRMQQLKMEIEKICKKICHSNTLDYDIEWFEYFPASINDDYCSKIILNAIDTNELKKVERTYPFTFGEDFGWYSKTYKAAMFGLGAGMDTPALHHSDYDFPEELLSTGMDMFKTIILEVLNS
ncbi:amidohydrolase [Maribacter sp. PR1]|uniref:Amidohydrolase n=1 Tax=Maribacter cobaltidurans TaxID=1178778 RepID=A0ABU7ISP9_9FLAO|nr:MULTISPECIES: amidohydrolase [Maribacter]MDC6388525.1 amidohydrolase [Maribacter sp. PR1]MEE1975914.1 amidohydrolase [Maribacter cobaltidurans]